ncbi:cysteine-rich with EGF-like domain protein 2 [Sarcoptes scabiei]|nr:cysteine-rich with EGF-like domain protein 2 [Sarcoptes scabiei]
MRKNHNFPCIDHHRNIQNDNFDFLSKKIPNKSLNFNILFNFTSFVSVETKNSSKKLIDVEQNVQKCSFLFIGFLVEDKSFVLEQIFSMSSPTELFQYNRNC